MKILAHGDIIDAGESVFTAAVKRDRQVVRATFTGVVRIENPSEQLRPFVGELEALLPELAASGGIDDIQLDFTQLRFCNSNGFYAIMDITETIYRHLGGPVSVRRLIDDDWQQETLPILLDYDAEEINARTTFDDVAQL